MSKITCPNCHSENVRTFRMVFESGTATAVHDTTGVGFGSGGSVGVGAAQTNSTSVTALAASVAPPAQRAGGTGGFVIAGFFVFGAVVSLPQKDGVGLAFVALLAAGVIGYASHTVNVWNKTEHPKLMAEWERQWKCLTCGAAFVPDGGEPMRPQEDKWGPQRFLRFLK